MASFAEIIVTWIQLLVPQPCFDEFFVNYNFFDVPCLKAVISKGLGYSLILGSMMVQVPQIVKIIRAKSSEGLSVLSFTLQVVALVSTFSYNYVKQYPFSSYGDAVFLLIQLWIILVLCFVYNNNIVLGVLYTIAIGGALLFMCSPACPLYVLQYMQLLIVPNIVTARTIQAVTNFRNSSTGQLSVVTQSLLFFGSLARVFTSVQETGDSTIILTFIVSSMMNGILLAQVLYYWDTKAKVKTQ